MSNTISFNRSTKTFSNKTRDEKKKFIDENCEVIDGVNEFMPDKPWISVIMNDCYLTSGHSIDDILSERDEINMLMEYGINQVASTFPKDEYHEHPVANIGFSPKDNKWYGWSHRAIYGFGIGDKPKECYPDKTVEGKTIENLDQAKEAAMKFADSVA